MSSPIINKIGATFIPVRDVRKASEWYSAVLGLEVKEENFLDHLYMVPMEGTGLVLDSKIYAEAHVYREAPFHFNSDDIHASYQYMKNRGVEVLTEVKHGAWFTFKDPDGNVLMVCQC